MMQQEETCWSEFTWQVGSIIRRFELDESLLDEIKRQREHMKLDCQKAVFGELDLNFPDKYPEQSGFGECVRFMNKPSSASTKYSIKIVIKTDQDPDGLLYIDLCCVDSCFVQDNEIDYFIF